MQLQGRMFFPGRKTEDVHGGMGKGWGLRGLLRDWSPLFLGQDAG